AGPPTARGGAAALRFVADANNTDQGYALATAWGATRRGDRARLLVQRQLHPDQPFRTPRTQHSVWNRRRSAGRPHADRPPMGRGDDLPRGRRFRAGGKLAEPLMEMTPVATTASTPILRLERLNKRFGTAQAADEVSLEVQAGDFFTFLGPSGSGKSSILR